MKKINLILLLLIIGASAQSQIDYHNKRFIKQVNLWVKDAKIESFQPDESESVHGKYFVIKDNDKIKGYAYVGRVNSCRSHGCSIATTADDTFEYFDYFAIFDLSAVIREISIYSYQATHGEEVTAKSWLKQFLGFDGNSTLEVGKNIDAISGATSSTNALTENVNEVVRILKTTVNKQ
ncbi:MAG: FMN-binding protein [Bacteroidales bacterium]|nr:FMN-binding protein [Bacteroidales bacterium]